MIIGATFSHKHLHSLQIDSVKTLEEFYQLGLKWLRLGCYWNEIEKNPGKYDFKNLKPLLNFCQERKLNVVMTVGMKAPRWPEYYLPKWLLAKANLGKFAKINLEKTIITKSLFRYIKNTILELSCYSCIKVWQVENEPFEPYGGKTWRISKDLLTEEIKLVRKLDKKREISINCGGLIASLPFFWGSMLELDFDILGLDIYFKHPFLKFFYIRNFSGTLLKRLFSKARKAGKKVWITELQAEPWEKEELVSQKENPPSFLPKDFSQNFKKIETWKPDGVFFWGFEYWFWRKKLGDKRYWREAKNYLASHLWRKGRVSHLRGVKAMN